MKVYLAGPDVFSPDAPDWAVQARTLCQARGVEALIPLDGTATDAEGIYQQNVEMIRAADVVIANLNPFRGAEPDSGTCFEVGFALALGKRVIGYAAYKETVTERVERWQGQALVSRRDRDGMSVENFGLPINLMLAVPARIVAGGLDEALAVL